MQVSNSNSKLTTAQKFWLKEFKKANPKVEFYNNGVVTIAVHNEFDAANICKVSVAYMSPDETKFRRKVGEYYAATRMCRGQYIPANPATCASYFMDCIS